MSFTPTPRYAFCNAMRALQHSVMCSSIGWRHRLLARLMVGAVLLTSIGAAWADDLIGQASVIDGDTLEIHGNRIRLWGMDAPETTQLCRDDDSKQYRCGAEAANELDAFIASRPVNCNPISLDQYGRTVATCTVGGADL